MLGDSFGCLIESSRPTMLYRSIGYAQKKKTGLAKSCNYTNQKQIQTNQRQQQIPNCGGQRWNRCQSGLKRSTAPCTRGNAGAAPQG